MRGKKALSDVFEHMKILERNIVSRLTVQ